MRVEKSEIMAFRVSKPMKDKITEAATSEGMSVSDWMRYVIHRAAKEVERDLASA